MKISRRAFGSSLLVSAAAAALPFPASPQTPDGFVHPGMLHNGADLARMREAVAAQSQPIHAGFEIMRKHPDSTLDYKSSGASEEIGRNPNVRFQFFDHDANAAYQSALIWCITGDKAHAAKAIAILNDWSATLKKISGLDAILCASLGGFKMANAAELLRYTASGWSSTDAKRFGRMLTEVFLPVIFNFAAFANGNWDTAAIKLMLAIAIYTDDRPLFDRAITYYLHGSGDGRLEHYIYANGQCQESGRDQQHTQLGLAHMGDACEIAWHQGLDLYGALDNRLLLGFEYTAKYGLGGEVPFQPDVDQTGKYRHADNSERSPLRAVYEQIYNHYTQRRGIPAPWTQKAAEKLRPEGAPFQADATGYGTLLYSRPAVPEKLDPMLRSHTVVHATDTSEGIVLSLVPLASGAPVEIERRRCNGGPNSVVARNVTAAKWVDRTAQTGQAYCYRASGSSFVTAMHGLPEGWRMQTVGNTKEQDSASFDGESFHVRAGGALPIERGGGFQCVQAALPKDGSLVARLYPLIASGSAQLGLIMRGPSQEVFLMVSPRGGPVEHPVWSASLTQHAAQAQTMHVEGSQTLEAPAIANGRLMAPLWLRLQRSQGRVGASISQDGSIWSDVGSCTAAEGPCAIGLFMNSGIEDVAAEISFDHVRLVV